VGTTCWRLWARERRRWASGGRGLLVGCCGADCVGLQRRKRAEANTWRVAGGLQLMGWARKEGMLEKGFNLFINDTTN
jgi:hypothetical protein